MGSLMAGWDKKKSGGHKGGHRNSLTKEEIDAFWKTKKNTDEDSIPSPSNLSPKSQDNMVMESSAMAKFTRSSTYPSPDRKGDLDMKKISLENIKRKSGWWTKSNWAFLNEPPVLESRANSYTPQLYTAKRNSDLHPKKDGNKNNK